MTHSLCFTAKLREIVYTPLNPIFSQIKWGFLAPSLHGLVDVMNLKLIIINQRTKNLNHDTNSYMKRASIMNLPTIEIFHVSSN